MQCQVKIAFDNHPPQTYSMPSTDLKEQTVHLKGDLGMLRQP